MADLDDIKYRIFKDRTSWRNWLKKYHQSKTEIWLGFYKRGSKQISISNSDAVEEALCFGWINGKVHKIDEAIYINRFTPRRDKSVWSPRNKLRIAKLSEKGIMTEAGLKAVSIAKANGSWDSVDFQFDEKHIADEILTALQNNKLAYENFSHFADGYKRDYIWWIESAKRDETRQRRIEKFIERCEKNQKPSE